MLKLDNILTGRAMPMSVASRAQAKLTTARELKAAMKRRLGLNFSTATPSFSVNDLSEPDIMLILYNISRCTGQEFHGRG